MENKNAFEENWNSAVTALPKAAFIATRPEREITTL